MIAGYRRISPDDRDTLFHQRGRMGVRVNVKLRSTESHHMYVTTKNPRTTPQRMEKRKYDPIAKRHVLYKESK